MKGSQGHSACCPCTFPLREGATLNHVTVLWERDLYLHEITVSCSVLTLTYVPVMPHYLFHHLNDNSPLPLLSFVFNNKSLAFVFSCPVFNVPFSSRCALLCIYTAEHLLNSLSLKLMPFTKFGNTLVIVSYKFFFWAIFSPPPMGLQLCVY